MIEGLEISNSSIQGIIVSYCVIAGLITVFRLAVRNPTRWWWDDLCAVLGVLAIVLQTAVLWLRIDKFPPLVNNKTASIAFFYLNSMCFYIEDWGARCAILFSIMRITPGKRLQRFMRGVAIGFFVLYAVNVALLVGTCEDQPGWHDSRSPPRCKLSSAVPIFRIISGILSDAILVIIPVYNLRQMRSAPGFRRTLMIIFGSSAWLTVACICQAAITMQLPGDPELIASMTEGFIALLLCNLSVVVIAVMQIFGIDGGLSNPHLGGSVELSNGVQIATLQENGADHQPRRSSVGSSLKKDQDSEYSPRGGLFNRWRKLDVDAGDSNRRAARDDEVNDNTSQA